MKSKNIPRLRFPEFQDAPEWKEKTLGEISLILRGGSPRPIESYLTNNLDGLNWLKIGDIDKDSKYVTHTQEKVLPTALSKTREVNPGDLILSNSMSFGRPYILKIKAYIHDGWIAITKIDDEFDRDYLYYFISSDASQTYFLNNAAGAAVLNLNAEIIKLLPIFAPKIDEQQKIADCLTSLDDLIAAESAKAEALKKQKKALMQQLFPREGEKVPKLRFPEFENSGKWEKVKLNKLGKIVSGLTYSPDDVRDNGLLVLRSSNVQNGEIKLEDNVYVRTDIKGANLTQTNDILICVRNGSKALIGKNALIPNDMPLCTHGAFMTIFRAKSPKFVFQLFQTNEYERQVNADLGATINSINGRHFINYEFNVPSEKEQQKIADCLSSIDELITAQNTKVKELKAHKKGLMQKLFPSSDKVSR